MRKLRNVQFVYKCDRSKKHATKKQIERFTCFCMEFLDMPDIHLVIEFVDGGIKMDGKPSKAGGLMTIDGANTASNPWLIEIKWSSRMFGYLAHELVHIDQYAKKRLRAGYDYQFGEYLRIWKGKLFDPAKYKKYQYSPDKKWSPKKSRRLRRKIPWEREACSLSARIIKAWECEK